MSGEQGWRISVNAEDYFTSQQKAQNVADRRPVIRKAADLVGPGIAVNAIPITDFSDPLATCNGFFSAEAGAFGAPNGSEAFTGVTVSDAVIGGTQTFVGVTSRDTYQRTFQRNPTDPSSLFWDGWKKLGDTGFEVGMLSPYVGSTSPNANWLVCDGSAFSAVLYPELATVLGSTTLPDLRGRAVYGVGGDWSLLGTDGLSEAARTKDLFHDHTIGVSTDGDHNHAGITLTSTLPSNTTTGGGAVQRLGPEDTHAHGIIVDGDHTHSASTAPDEGPVLRGVGLNWLIRALV